MSAVLPVGKQLYLLLSGDERRQAVFLLLLMFVGMTLEMVGVGLVIPVVAVLTGSAGLLPVGLRPENLDQSWAIGLAMAGLVVIFILKNLFLTFLAWRQASFVHGVQVQVSGRLFAFYLGRPYTFHLQRNSAQLIRNLTTDVNLLTTSLMGMMTIMTELLVLLGVTTLLLFVEPVGTVVTVGALGGVAWLFQRATRTHILRWGSQRQFHDGRLLQHLQQGLGGAKEVKLLGREADFQAQFHSHNAAKGKVSQYQHTLQQIPRLWLEVLAVCGLALLVMSMVWQGADKSTMVPTLALFAAAAFRLMPSVNRILTLIQSVRFSVPAIGNLYAELLPQAAAPFGASARHEASVPPSEACEIALDNIVFSYPGTSVPALKGISMEIGRGECVGIIGPSGSGKSTLVDVILGLLSPDAGEVRVRGSDIRTDLRAWQDRIGYVPQSIYLTDDTIRRNVAFGLADERIDDAAVIGALKDAQLEDLVGALPDGIETIVGENGLRLSGGQRQRIGIARALYHNPDILVLDEATSALDGEAEQGVMRAVNALKGDKTILIVAHRLSTIAECGRLFRIAQGTIAAVGTPAEILSGDEDVSPTQMNGGSHMNASTRC
ncbi:MAG: ABC transporter ATP-binding protein [Halothiobacillaceae bacterium]|nr:ABC transporter ATP-binding protein [Halothiobacillaceae bacterium]